MPAIFIHPMARCEAQRIGSGTQVLAFSYLNSTVQVGNACEIKEHAFIDADVTLGHGVRVMQGAYLGPGLLIEDGVQIGPNASLAARDGDRQETSATKIMPGAFIGANAVVFSGLTVGAQARVEAGSVVKRSVPPNAIVSGNPAEIVGYVGTSLQNLEHSSDHFSKPQNFGVIGANLKYLPKIEDMRGNLTVGELDKDIPFNIKRFFLVHGVPNSEVRGEHAHRRCHQFLVAVKGSIRVLVDDGRRREEVKLDRPNLGLHLAPMVWGVQFGYSADAVLLVLASDPYDPDDYIRNYEEFLQLVQKAE